MSKTATIDLFTGAFLWLLAMIVPLLAMLVKGGAFKTTLLNVVYPILLAFLSRTGKFWVTKSAVFMAAIVTYFFSMAMRLIGHVKDAMDDPDKDRALAITGYSLNVVVFIVMLIAVGAFIEPMYSKANFYS